MEQTITLQVNGEGRTFQAPTDSTLLEVLQEVSGRPYLCIASRTTR